MISLYLIVKWEISTECVLYLYFLFVYMHNRSGFTLRLISGFEMDND